ncbi:class D sortase [Neobacillus piezotolerans]|uniref:Class D sortase n=1 Tax=Neobacillus piezotolerans TaxID=2259171 RepID=A0A3D8GPA5_9BACI|nr:class D sortase [Neobacillus piezotolerans]RDU36315.1 class D sortase [Neobacillus piezotolerans]
MMFIIAGIAVIIVGGFQLAETQMESGRSLEEAKRLVTSGSFEAGADKPGDVPAVETPKPGFGEIVGLLEIPAINSELAIVEGTDPDDLKKGVGHFQGSYFPGDGGQIVLSGHRDTVFRRLGELKAGDVLNIRMPKTETLYEITGTKIVDADDRTIITLQDDMEELILTTCYPFSYVGNAPERYIIYAKPANGG